MRPRFQLALLAVFLGYAAPGRGAGHRHQGGTGGGPGRRYHRREPGDPGGGRQDHGDRREREDSVGRQVIDLSRSTVSPGLVDAHTHLCMVVQPERDAGNYYITTLLDPDAFRSIEGVVNAKTMLEAGFTSVRDVGNEGRYACVQVRRAIQRGLIPGPTMITAGRIIAPYGGQFHLQPDKPALAEPEYYFADTHDEMVKAVRENVHYGATVIKIVVDDQRYIYSTDDIAFIKDEAARAGMKLAAHAWTEPGAHNAAEAAWRRSSMGST